MPNRAALERAADKMNADGVIFNNVYDNGYSNNQVIFSLRDDLKNGRVYKKGVGEVSTKAPIDNNLAPADVKSVRVASFNKAQNNYNLMNQMDAFASKYGYPKADRRTILSNRKTNKQVRGTIARHNTYMRGVEPYGFESNDVINAKRILGDDMTQDDFLKYAATHKRTPEQGIWISPSENAFIYGGRGETVYVRRPYKLGANRSEWFKQGDFDIQPGARGEISAPWYSPQYGTGQPETELISNVNLNFAGWANPNKYKNRVTLNNKVNK